MNNIHDGHRARLRETVSAVGLDNLPEVNQLEYILSFAIKRKDTNPLAHVLLDKYKSIYAILNLSCVELMQNEGIGLNVASFLTSLLPICRCVLKSKTSKDFKIYNTQDCIEFMLNRCTNTRIETMVIATLDNLGNVLDVFEYTSNNIEEINVPMGAIVNDLTSHNAKYIVIGHNHPDGNPNPSKNDTNFFNKFSSVMSACGIEIRQNLVLGKTSCYSIKDSCSTDYKQLSCKIPPQFKK